MHTRLCFACNSLRSPRVAELMPCARVLRSLHLRLAALAFLVMTGLAPVMHADLAADFSALPQWHSPAGNPRMGAFDCAGYAALAAALQKAGPEQAAAQLRVLAKRDDALKVVPLCRMLFTAKAGSTFRGPRLGGGSTCPRTDGADWPLDPIALIDGVPFLVTAKYGAMLTPETAAEYVEYCLAECAWSATPLSTPDKTAVDAAFAKLRELIGGTRKGTWELYFRGQMKGAK